jgi:hypothetical protein
MGTQRVKMKEVIPWMVRWASRAGKRDFLFCLGCSSQPVQNIFFLNAHYFNAFFPIVQQAGQAAVLARLSLSMSLWFSHLALFEYPISHMSQHLLN